MSEKSTASFVPERLSAHEPVIARCPVPGLGGQFGMGEEAEDIHAIVQGDNHYTFLRQIGAVVPGFGACTDIEAAAVDPDHDG